MCRHCGSEPPQSTSRLTEPQNLRLRSTALVPQKGPRTQPQIGVNLLWWKFSKAFGRKIFVTKLSRKFSRKFSHQFSHQLSLNFHARTALEPTSQFATRLQNPALNLILATLRRVSDWAALRMISERSCIDQHGNAFFLLILCPQIQVLFSFWAGAPQKQNFHLYIRFAGNLGQPQLETHSLHVQFQDDLSQCLTSAPVTLESVAQAVYNTGIGLFSRSPTSRPHPPWSSQELRESSKRKWHSLAKLRAFVTEFLGHAKSESARPRVVKVNLAHAKSESAPPQVGVEHHGHAMSECAPPRVVTASWACYVRVCAWHAMSESVPPCCQCTSSTSWTCDVRVSDSSCCHWAPEHLGRAMSESAPPWSVANPLGHAMSESVPRCVVIALPQHLGHAMSESVPPCVVTEHPNILDTQCPNQRLLGLPPSILDMQWQNQCLLLVLSLNIQNI